MYKQSPSRNNRSKGFKAKHILKICLLLAVCFWLIFQVKRSHNKKEEFDTEDEKVVGKVQSDAEILRLGRKDLPRITETDTDEHSFDEEEQEAEEEDNISEDREDEIDENDLEKAETETETEHEDEINKSEKEVEKAELAYEKEHIDEDNERDGNGGGSVDNQTDNEEIDDGEDEDRSETEEHEEDGGGSKGDYDEGDVKLEEQVHDGDNMNTHEAREDQYKADDASSEVAHDNQTILPEAGNETVISIKEDVGLQPKRDEANNNVTSTNVTVTEFKESKHNSISSQNVTIEGGNGNENLITVKSISEHINKSEGMDGENQLQPVVGSNSTDVVESLLSNTRSAEGGEPEDNGTVESDESVNVIQHEPIDASGSTLTQDEKDSRMDLDTLPEITTEVQNTDETMIE